MTNRLYYEDATLTTFTARVVEQAPVDGGRFQSVLDRTAFYPTSGGQPHDVGTLDGKPVVDVFEDEQGRVVHVVEGALAVGEDVAGRIDWTRRFDHMQQHTGQHILSAAFEETCGAATVSVHLGAGSATIDLGREVTPAEIAAAESAANDVIWKDRPVTVRFVDADAARDLPLRKVSSRAGLLRLVDVRDCDLSACGGTHVSSTGQVGIVAVSASERFKGGTRITFRCGARVLDAYRGLRDVTGEIGRLLSVGTGDMPAAVARVMADVKARERQVADLTGEMVRYRAAEWRAGAEPVGRFRGVLKSAPDADGGAVKQLAQAVVAGDAGLVAVIVGGGTPTPVVVARSTNVDLDAGAVIKAIVAALGGRGGGRAELAQGGVNADAETTIVTARQLFD